MITLPNVRDDALAHVPAFMLKLTGNHARHSGGELYRRHQAAARSLPRHAPECDRGHLQ
jgi:hypothetical protein